MAHRDRLNELQAMKPDAPLRIQPAIPQSPAFGDFGQVQPTRAPAAKGPIQFRFVLTFAPQLSTPCSRGLAIKPRAGNPLRRSAPRLFQSYLQRHSILQ